MNDQQSGWSIVAIRQAISCLAFLLCLTAAGDASSQEKDAAPPTKTVAAPSDRNEVESSPGSVSGKPKRAAKPPTKPPTKTPKPTNTDADASGLPIPNSLSDGRKINAIGVFQSQVINVVPSSYQPVSMGELSDAIGRADAKESGGDDLRLLSSFYDIRLVGGTLVSDRSSIDIQFRQNGSRLRSLGKINFSLTNQNDRDASIELNSASGTSATIESSSTGELLTFLRGVDDQLQETNLDFSWQATGKQQGIYRTYTLQIPRTMRTRIVLSTPADMLPETSDGVLQSLPGPPPDADVESRVGDVRWHSIDAGGLSKIRLTIRPRIDNEQSTPTLIRDQSRRYEILPATVDWLHTIKLQAPGGRAIPELIVSQGEVTSVKIDNASVRFTQSVGPDGSSRITILPPISGLASDLSTVNVSLLGSMAWEDANGWCNLPIVHWSDAVIVAHGSCEAQIILRAPLTAVTWELPQHWTQQAADWTESNATKEPSLVLRAKGPPEPDRTKETVTGDSPESAKASIPKLSNAWSRIRVARRPSVSDAQLLSEFQIDNETADTNRIVNARARFDVVVNENRVAPFTLELEPSWNLNRISFVASGRALESTSLNQRGRTVTFWPEAEDIENGHLQMVCEGFRRLAAAPRHIDLPPMWFVRLRDVRANTLVSIVPPNDLNWTGPSAFRESRLTKEWLSDDESRFFSNVTEDALIYRSPTGMTPSLSLERPGVIIDVRTSLRFQRIADEVRETIVVTADANSQLIKEFSLQTNVNSGIRNNSGIEPSQENIITDSIPDYRWSLHSTDDGLPINLPSTAVTRTTDGTYTIDLGDASLRNRQLIGRRQYSVDQPLTVTLPIAIGTASQDADVIVGQGLQVTRRDADVQRVPISRRSLDESKVDRSLNDFDPTKSVRLRYDAINQSQIVIAALESDPSVSLIWQQQIDLTASSRGTDLIRGDFEVSATRPIKIFYQPNLQLVSLLQNNVPIDLASISERPIVLTPQNSTDTVRAVWSRESIQHGWVRHCRIPRIHMAGIPIKSSVRMKASADTFALASLLKSADSQSNDGIDVTASRFKLLVHRDHALAGGWLLALLLFGASWALARRSLLSLAALIAMVVVSVFLWWTWQSAIIGWILLPMVAAALLETTLQWEQFRIAGNGLNGEESDSDSQEFSVHDAIISSSGKATSLPMALLIVSTLLASGSLTHAQESNQPDDDIKILVPIDSQEKPLGDKVYIPGQLYQELFGANESEIRDSVSFLSANYRVDLEAVSKSNESGGSPSVEADYTIRVGGTGSLVRLPLDASVIRRIEVRQGESNRIVRFTPDENGTVVASLPEGNLFRIRVILDPALSVVADSSSLSVPIPQVASSRVLIESNRTIDKVEVPGAVGELSVDRSLRRWEANLGPVASLGIQFSSAGAAPTADKSAFRRRYIVTVDKSTTHIDCQVDLPDSIDVGDEAQMLISDPMIADGATPVVTSAAWRFVQADTISPTRQRLTVVKLADVKAPLQLLWSRPSVINDPTLLANRQSVQLPDVGPVSSSAFQPAWIAIDHPVDLRVSPVQRGETQSLTASQFAAQWYGLNHIPQPQQTLIALDALPSLVTLQNQKAKASAKLAHHLHIGPTHCQVDFLAIIQPGETTVQRRTLRIPKNVTVSKLTRDGKSIDHVATRYPDYVELAIGELSGTQPIELEASGLMRNPKNRLFSLPSIQVWPAMETSNAYTVTREVSMDVEIDRRPDAVDVPLTNKTKTEFLTSGEVVVANWEMNPPLDDAANQSLVGRLKIRGKKVKFDSAQQIDINYADGRWSMSSTIEFNNGDVPDYVDLEIPNRWSESLTVFPDLLWTQNTSTNSSFQVVRIACGSDALVDNSITLSSELSATDTGRITAPRIQVLGVGEREVTVSLPNRLTTERIAWEARGVSPATETDGRSVYTAQNNAWSIELAPLSSAKSDPIALAADSRVFLQNDKTLIVTRWDLVPNGLDWIDVRIPSRALCLGAWSAGRSVRIGKNPTNPAIARIPLSLSRLAQSVEVLLQVPVSKARHNDYLPQLVDVDVASQWVAYFSPSNSVSLNAGDGAVASDSVGEISSDENRCINLANSVVDAIDQSLDTLADRPADEVATWLSPWVARYQDVARSSENRSNLNSLMIGETVENEDQLPTTVTTAWNDLDSRMLAHIKRFLTEDQFVQIENERPTFGANQFVGYRLSSVSDVSSLKPLAPIEAVSPGMNEARTLLTNLLTLLMAAGLLWLLRPLQPRLQTLCRHPAFWLAMTGIVGLFVAPLPVSLAVIFVAVIMPIVPQGKVRHRKPTSGSQSVG